ncbi:MAG: glycosyltransferase family 4 protein, partial [Pseudomonadota bacterium]
MGICRNAWSFPRPYVHWSIQSAFAHCCGLLAASIGFNAKKATGAGPRVLYYSHNLDWQGAPNSLFELALGVKHQGHLQPVVITAADGPLRPIFEAAGITVLHDPRKGNPFKSERTFEAYISKLAMQFRRIKPDLVHANTLQSFPAIIAAKRLGIPVVFNIRESESPKTYFDFLPEALRQYAYNTYTDANWLVFVSQTTRARWADVAA